VGNLYIRIFLKKFLLKIVFEVFNTLFKQSSSNKKNRFFPALCASLTTHVRRRYSKIKRGRRKILLKRKNVFVVPGLEQYIIRSDALEIDGFRKVRRHESIRAIKELINDDEDEDDDEDKGLLKECFKH